MLQNLVQFSSGSHIKRRDEIRRWRQARDVRIWFNRSTSNGIYWLNYASISISIIRAADAPCLFAVSAVQNYVIPSAYYPQSRIRHVRTYRIRLCRQCRRAFDFVESTFDKVERLKMWLNEWMNVSKVTLSQLKLLQGHWTEVTSCKYQLLVKTGAVMSGHQTMPWTELFWSRPETGSKTRQSWRSMAESSEDYPGPATFHTLIVQASVRNYRHCQTLVKGNYYCSMWRRKLGWISIPSTQYFGETLSSCPPCMFRLLFGNSAVYTRFAAFQRRFTYTIKVQTADRVCTLQSNSMFVCHPAAGQPFTRTDYSGRYFRFLQPSVWNSLPQTVLT